MFEQVSRHALVGINTETGSVHVAQVDHRIAVLELVRVEEVFVCFFVALLDEVGNAVEVDCAEVDHRVGVAHLCSLEIAANCKLAVLFDPISAEVTISNFVFSWRVIALRRFYEVRDCLFGTLLYSETMLVEDAKIEERLSSFGLDYFRRNSRDILLVNR